MTEEITLVDDEGNPREPGPAALMMEGRPLTALETIVEERENGPAWADAVIVLADGLVQEAGPMWDALLEVPPSNTAKPLLDLIVAKALDAALPLVEPEP